MGIKFRTQAGRDAYRRSLEAPPSVLGLPGMYDRVADWHNAGLPKPVGAPIAIAARYLAKEKRWLVLVDSEKPFVTEHASLAEAMRLAGAAVESR